jgi:D-xylulose reductase
VVLGAGAIGLLIAQVWRALGGSLTSVIDIDTKRLSIASDLGIQTWTSTPADAGINTLFEASGSSAAISTWVQALDPGGRMIVVGKPNDNIPLDWVNMLRKEVQIFTSRYFTLDDFKQSQQLIINRQVDVRPLIGRTVPFEELSNQQGRIIFEQAKQMVRLVIQM